MKKFILQTILKYFIFRFRKFFDNLKFKVWVDQVIAQFKFN